MLKPRSTVKYDVEIGGRIRERRLNSGFSQEALAEQLDVTFQQLQKYETGKNRISAARLRQVALALQISMAELYEGSPSKRRRAKYNDDHLQTLLRNSSAILLLRSFSKIKNANIENLVVNYCKSLVER